MVNTTFTKYSVQDLLLGLIRSGGKKIELDAILPYFIIPGLLLVGTWSRTVTITVMVVITMGALYIYSRPRQKNRSSFFFSWTIASIIYMFLIFEDGVLHFFEITVVENSIFILLFTCTLYFYYKMKTIAEIELSGTGSKGKEYSPVLTSDSHYCQICQIEVNERFFHSIWWDCCILRPNYIHFLAGHLFAFATLLLGTNLGLTTVCQPFILYGPILMPLDCEDVYYDFDLAICFVTCVYALGYALVIALVLIRQLIVYLPKYCEPQWKKLVNVFNV